MLKSASRMPSRSARRFLLLVLAVALAYAIFSSAGRDLIDWNLSVLVIAVVAVAYWLPKSAKDLAPSLENWLFWPALLLPCYVAFQLIPLPIGLLRFISPARAALADKLAPIGAATSYASISVIPANTSIYLVRTLAYLLAFLLAREIAWREWKHRSWLPVIPLIAIGVIESALGLTQSTNGATVSGTYVNKNHFAGLLEMILPLCLAWGLSRLLGERRRNDSGVAHGIQAAGILGLAAVIAAGLLASVSKMGFVAALGGLFVMSGLAFWTMAKGWTKWLAVAALAAVCGFLIVFIPSDELMKGFASLFSDEWATGEGRWPIWLDTFRLIAAFPATGCGLGNYGTAFLKFQTAVVDRDFTFAHNDYLELISELGVVGFAIVGLLMLAVLTKALDAGTRGPDRATRFLGLGSVGAIAAIALHSLADFNMYIPVNALVLAWISGIAVALPSRLMARTENEPAATRPLILKRVALLVSAILIVYAPARIWFERSFRANPQAEAVFCRFGICDTDAMIAAEIHEHGGSIAKVPLSVLNQALERDPAEPSRWCDLGEALNGNGRQDLARYCFSNALELGPNIPPVLLRVANFYFNLHENRLALAQCARVLGETADYDDPIFQSYRANKIALNDALADGLPSTMRAWEAYLRYFMGLDDNADAATVWTSLLARSRPSLKIASEYVNYLYNRQRYEAAAQAWAAFVGPSGVYLKSNWLYNGDFESEPTPTVFDWHIESLGEDVEAALDSTVAHTGSHSLRLRFGGKENVNYFHAALTAFVRPGTYRFEAFVRTQSITTDRGVGLHLFDSEKPARLDLKTEQLTGTNGWTKLEHVIRVPQDTQLITIRAIREPSLKFDNQISGTAWIDSLRLEKLD